MRRAFIHTRTFDRQWKEMGLDDLLLGWLQDAILENPQAGALVQGAGGVRKLRVGLRTKGKSGGLRVIYFDVPGKQEIYLLMVYAKRVKQNLTPEDKRDFAEFTRQLRESEGTRR